MISGIKLENDILRAVEDLGFTTWTDIQLKSIPLVQQGKDVIGQSYTGSGKTAAFGLPIIEKIVHGKGIQALIIAPTRELAEQIMLELNKFSRYKKMNTLAVYGGVSINPQIDRLRTADIVVGTPGRLMDHMERQTIKLNNVKFLVLDEADRMLDMGFIDDIRRIISVLPKERQTLLFSATIPSEIQDIVRRFMKAPEKIKVQTYVDELKLAQKYYNVDSKDKFSLLVHLMKLEHNALTLIFCSTRHMVDSLARNLYNLKVPSQALHGGLTQMRRQKSIDLFHTQKIKVLVASDVAARGLDIKGVTHVINYDVPKTSKEYIHRIGRTARAGEDGKVITLVSPPDYDNFRNVLSDRSLKIEKAETPKFEKIIVQQGPKSFGMERSYHQGGRSQHPGRSGHRSFRDDNRGPRRSSGDSRDSRNDESGRSHSGSSRPSSRFEVRRNFAQRKGFSSR